MYIYIYVTIIILISLLFCIIPYNKESFMYDKNNVAVIICGFAPRSFKYTYKSIDKNIIQHLKSNHFNVDVFHHSLLSKTNRIESNRPGENDILINNDDVNLLKAKIKTEYQEDIVLPDGGKNCWKDKKAFQNACRGIYSEYNSFKLINPNHYDSTILITSDSLFLKPISIKEVNDSIENKNIVYTTPFNQYGGIANGFYICNSLTMKKITNRFLNIETFCKHNPDSNERNINSEYFLKTTLDDNNIINKNSSMFYLKIRANKKSNQYIKLLDKYHIENSEEIKKLYS